MKTKQLKALSLKEFAEEMGINYEVLKIKQKLMVNIKSHCQKHKISQRALAKKVPGLTQDRVSKLFNEQIGGMTIDKLIQILSALKIKIDISVEKLAA